MNVRKHLAGLLLFSFIFGAAIFINYYLTLPEAKVPPVPVRPLVKGLGLSHQTINYEVRQVSIDLNTVTGYTTLSLNLPPGQSAPEKIWVTTFYFSPDVTHSGWTSTTESLRPFARGRQVEVVAADAWDRWWGNPSDEPRVAYFAHVQVTAADDEYADPPALRFDRDTRGAHPVVVHWADARGRSASSTR
jgi:hypothetical protein